MWTFPISARISTRAKEGGGNTAARVQGKSNIPDMREPRGAYSRWMPRKRVTGADGSANGTRTARTS